MDRKVIGKVRSARGLQGTENLGFDIHVAEFNS
jgi:hypothetical protein